MGRFNLIDFRLLPGQAHDLRGTAALIDGLTCGQFLADRAFDANWLREMVTQLRWSSTCVDFKNFGKYTY
jgi:hypothetical protein